MSELSSSLLNYRMLEQSTTSKAIKQVKRVILQGPTCDITSIVCNQATAKLESIFSSLFYASLSRTTIHGSSAEDNRKLRKNKSLFLRHRHILNR